MRLQSKPRVFPSAEDAARAKSPEQRRERVYKVEHPTMGELYVLERSYHLARSRALIHWGGRCAQLRQGSSTEGLLEAVLSLPGEERDRILAQLTRVAHGDSWEVDEGQDD